MTEYLPRPPTMIEAEELKRHLVQAEDWPEETTLEGVYMAVFDPYVTDSPGYVGKVLVAVFGGSESMYSAFQWFDVPRTPGEDDRPYGWSRIHQEEGF